MNFGENLKKMRKTKGMSQEELASKVNVSRQSISKWENGESYPEMNNIIELCKIFKCEINELVDDSISSDEGVKMGVVKFKKEKQKKMKTMSSIIYYSSICFRVILLLGVLAVIIAMIATPIIITNADINEKGLAVNIADNKIELISDSEEGFYFEFNGKKEIIDNDLDTDEKLLINGVLENLNKYPKESIIVSVEFICVFAIVSIILLNGALLNIQKLGKNLRDEVTPFTLDNVKYIRHAAFYMIALLLLPIITSIPAALIIGNPNIFDIGFVNIIEILLLLAFAYAFEYGYEIQLDSNGKMYGDENE